MYIYGLLILKNNRILLPKNSILCAHNVQKPTLCRKYGENDVTYAAENEAQDGRKCVGSVQYQLYLHSEKV